MSHRGLPGRALGVLAVWATCLTPLVVADDPVVVRPRDPRLVVERLSRHLDSRDGLPGSYLAGVDQDRDGFIWVSGPEGLSRYDGSSFRTFRPQATQIVPGWMRTGRRVFYAADGDLHEIREDRVVDLHTPRSGPGEWHWSAAIAHDGTIWFMRDNEIWREDGTGGWLPVAAPAPSELPPRGLYAGTGSSIFVSNRDVLWSLAPDGTSHQVARIQGIVVLVQRADGSLVVGANQSPGPVTTRLFELRDGETKLLLEQVGAKIVGLVDRGSRLWVSTDHGLFGVAEGSSPLFVAVSETFNAAGAVFVDREGSLWISTFRGLVQLPEPETYTVAFMTVTRNLAHAGRRTWLSAWGEMARFEDGPQGLEAFSYGGNFGIVCQDASGAAWAQAARGFARLGATGYDYPPRDEVRGNVAACDLGPTGTMWVSAFPPLLLAMRPGDGEPHDVHVRFPTGIEGFERIREDRNGRLWGAAGRMACSTDAAALLDRRPVTWTCEEAIAEGNITDFAFMPSGDVWVGTTNGLARRSAGRWELLGGNSILHSRWIIAVRPSSSGGVWLASMGGLTRVVERPGTKDGLEVAEDLSAWHGLPTQNGQDVAEDADGTLWIATDAGLLKVPNEVRHARRTPPLVALIEANADGRELPTGLAVELPYRRNRLEVRFAALSFREPAAIRYRSRVRPEDPWSAPARSPLFRFIDLAPGRYRIEVEASLDGELWSEKPATFPFRVLKPWYLQAWFFAVAAFALAGLLTLVYRLRVRTLLRLERQRTRIAMDLHDEVGSGLGTISVLAGIVGRPDLAPAQRDEFAARMAAVSRELSQALGDIVWSLRPGSGTLDAAWNQVVDRARPLFASGRPRLAVIAPENVPALPLSVLARRSFFLIAIEALHNAARHSGATSVTLELAPAGAEWVLTITDDGRGIAPTPQPPERRGLGLDGMRARAAEMGGSIRWEAAPGGGTTVVLRFRPDSD
jgi:signal transduction histidine kinase